MRKLLSSNLSRLFRSRLFYFCVLVMVGFGAFAVLMRYRDISADPAYVYRSVDGLLLLSVLYGPILWAVFTGLFVGTEYSDGTLRNKVIVGHRRTAIYLTNLLICILAVLIMHLGYTTVVLGLGTLLLEPMEMSPKTLLGLQCLSLGVIISTTALFVLLGMMISSKASGSVAVILLSFVLLMGALTINMKLSQPEYYDAMYYLTEDGSVAEIPVEKNPDYLTGTSRQVYEFLYDFLPSGQGLQICQAEELPEEPWQLPLYALTLTVISTGIGLVGFQKKNLK